MNSIHKAFKKGNGKPKPQKSLIGRVMASKAAKTAAESNPASQEVANTQADSNTPNTVVQAASSGAPNSAAPSSGAPAPTDAKAQEHAHLPVSSEVVFHIDTDTLKRKGMVSHDDDKATPTMTNEYRAIKHKILYNAFGPASDMLTHSNMVMISSTGPNEGKTFTAVNLALSVASEKDKTVLLVDADVLKPSVSKLLEIQPAKGLIDYLEGDVNDIADVIYTTDIPTLRLLPAGALHHLSNELLASDKMAALAEELASRYPDRLIIFDCPPLLGVIETITMSKFMGQAMIVVEQSKTSLSNVDEAVSLLNRDMAMGFIINKAMYGNYSQYGYGYGYGKNAMD